MRSQGFSDDIPVREPKGYLNSSQRCEFNPACGADICSRHEKGGEETNLSQRPEFRHGPFKVPESHYQVTSPAGNEARWRDNGTGEKGDDGYEEGESHGNMELRGPKTVLRNTLTGREKIIESPMGSNAGDIPRRNFFLFSLSPFLPTGEP